MNSHKVTHTLNNFWQFRSLDEHADIWPINLQCGISCQCSRHSSDR